MQALIKDVGSGKGVCVVLKKTNIPSNTQTHGHHFVTKLV